MEKIKTQEKPLDTIHVVHVRLKIARHFRVH